MEQIAFLLYFTFNRFVRAEAVASTVFSSPSSILLLLLARTLGDGAADIEKNQPQNVSPLTY